MIISGASYASVTVKDVHDVYRNLINANGLIMAPILVIDNSTEINGRYRNWQVHITTGMMRKLKNRDELALVLGHELTHWINGDTYSHYSVEYRADKGGAFLSEHAGYSKCHGAELFRWLPNHNNTTHPDNRLRYKRICK